MEELWTLSRQIAAADVGKWAVLEIIFSGTFIGVEIRSIARHMLQLDAGVRLTELTVRDDANRRPAGPPNWL